MAAFKLVAADALSKSLDELLIRLSQNKNVQLVYESRLTHNLRMSEVEFNRILKAQNPIIRLTELLSSYDLTLKNLNAQTFIIIPREIPMTEPSQTSVTPDMSNRQADNRMETIVVTGINLNNHFSLFQTAYPVSLLSRDYLDKNNYLSVADALTEVPGLYIENSAGVLGNNVYSRGLPNDNFRYVRMLEDGLPTFEEGAGAFTNADIFSRLDTGIANIEVVRGGSAAVVTSNAPGSTVNIVTKKGTDRAEGDIKLTTSDYGLRRVDLFVAGPVNAGLRYHFGGYWADHTATRKLPFDLPGGGQLRAGLTYLIDEGQIYLGYKLIDDHNIFYSAVPMQDAKTPLEQLNPAEYSFLSKELTGLTFYDGSADKSFSPELSQGVKTRTDTLTLLYQQALSANLKIINKSRWIKGDIQFTSGFSGGNGFNDLSDELDKLKQVNSQIDALRFEYVFGPTQLFELNELPNKLLIDFGLWQSRIELNNFINDFSLAYRFNTGALTEHKLALGYYYSGYKQSQHWNWQALAVSAENRPKLVDIIGVNSDGDKILSYTDKGVWRHHSNLQHFNDKVTHQAIYFVDNIQFNQDWRFDIGFRHQQVDKQGLIAQTRLEDLRQDERSDAYALAQVSVFNGDSIPYEFSTEQNAATMGFNYQHSDQVSFFTRYSSAFRVTGEFAQWFNCCNPVEKNIRLIEFGGKYKSKHTGLLLTLFSNEFPDIALSNQVVTDDGDVSIETAQAASSAEGIEWEWLWQSGRHFDLNITGFYQDIRYDKFLVGDHDFSGNQIIRQPKLSLSIRPTYYWGDANHSVYFSAHYMGKRYQDAANMVELAQYSVISAGVQYHLTEQIQVRLNISNLTNELGLTEGNPRSSVISTEPAPYFVGRAIDGRHAQLSINFNLW